MTKFFKFMSMAVIVATTASLASCSDDKDEPTPTPDPNPTPGTEITVDPSTVFPSGVPTQVGDYVITKNADGLVSKIVEKDGDEDYKTVTFTYGGPAASKARSEVNIPSDYDMTMNVEWGNDEDGVDFYITLNDKGYVEYAYEVDEDKIDGDQAEEWWFKYDGEGRMIEMKRTEGGNEVTKITYNAAGDITTVVTTDDDGDESTTTVAYTDAEHKAPVANKGGMMLYDYTFTIDMDEMAPAYFAGLLGKGTANLPLSYVEKYKNIMDSGYIDEGLYEYFCTWILDSNGMPEEFIGQNAKGYDKTEKSFKW